MTDAPKTFVTPSGKTLHMQWTDVGHQLMRRMGVFREIQQVNGVKEPFNITAAANALYAAFGNRQVMGIDALDSNDKLRGMIIYTRPHHGAATIAAIWSDPNFRRQGIADRMLGRALGHLRTLGVEGVHAEIGLGNKPSRLFFENHGWAFTGRIEPFKGTSYTFHHRPLRSSRGFVSEFCYE